ncbi:MAG: rRNA maturation RNase YbeY [Candidatus Omnitrophica bacterium]|nr:rRNA maturation RNase YbeY [Candidatus Omnitrophota bacterium]MCB9747732.1 rRNA maturation RNase YbeY [Candidatus Omnitrophota bacterium]
MEIEIQNQQKKIKISPQRILRIIKKILQHEKVAQATLTIIFVSHQKIRALNKKYLHKDYATDVLAFDLRDDHKKRRTILGDIAISVDAAVKNARVFQSTVDREIVLYVVHGILHLLGYDDHSLADIKRMRRKEQELMEKFRK